MDIAKTIIAVLATSLIATTINAVSFDKGVRGELFWLYSSRTSYFESANCCPGGIVIADIGSATDGGVFSEVTIKNIEYVLKAPFTASDSIGVIRCGFVNDPYLSRSMQIEVGKRYLLSISCKLTNKGKCEYCALNNGFLAVSERNMIIDQYEFFGLGKVFSLDQIRKIVVDRMGRERPWEWKAIKSIDNDGQLN